MSRGLSSALKSALADKEVHPFTMVHMDFDSGSLRLWTGRGDLTWGGKTWTGSAGLLGFSTISETTEVQSKSLNISLSGMPAEILLLALDEDYQGRDCTVYFGAFSGGAIVVDPIITFRGKMDVMPISDSGDTSAITLTVENRLVVLHRSRGRKWTASDQKIDYPNDKGFNFVQSIQGKKIQWGPG